MPPGVERPKRTGQGDYATNAAMLLAPVLDVPPRVIAEKLGGELTGVLGDRIERAEVAGPGFLNLFLSDLWHRGALRLILAAGVGFGAGGAERPEKILTEFVSANPTGPLVAASGRHAAYGDALARILEYHGHSRHPRVLLQRRRQPDPPARSVGARRAQGEPVPEGGYHGEYVMDLAAEIPRSATADVEVLASSAVELLLAAIKATLERYGVHYDNFFSERTLHEGDPSDLDRAMAVLERAGHVYRSEGATWLRTTTFGDDKDRVVVRSNGEPTYLAADIAYLPEQARAGLRPATAARGSRSPRRTRASSRQRSPRSVAIRT